MTDTEDSRSVNLSNDSVETDSPPIKVPRLQIPSDTLETYASTSFLILADPYPNSDLQSAIHDSTTTLDNFVSVQTSTENVIKPKEKAVLLDKGGSGDRSFGKLPEREDARSDLYQSLCQGTSKDEDNAASEHITHEGVDCDKRNDEAVVKDAHVHPSPTINVCVLNEILDVLDKNQSKTSEMIVQEYVSCPKRCLKVKDFLCQNIHEFLKLTGQDNSNNVGSAHLKCTMEKAECSTIIKLLSDAFKRNNTKLTSNNGYNNSSAANVLTGPPEILADSDNVQTPDIADEVRMEDERHANGVIDIDISNENGPSSSSSTQSTTVFNMENATNWQDRITDMLFRTLHAESRLVSRNEQKIARMGKRLFSSLFSEQEILGGFARAKKDIPAYDETRVFEISQIINFMLNHTNVCSLENFRSSQHENDGLDGGNRETFWQSVMIKFASDERKRIKNEQS